MDINTLIKIEAIKNGFKTDAALAEACGWSRANFSDRLKRDSWKVQDLERIADAMGCKLVIEFKKE